MASTSWLNFSTSSTRTTTQGNSRTAVTAGGGLLQQTIYTTPPPYTETANGLLAPDTDAIRFWPDDVFDTDGWSFSLADIASQATEGILDGIEVRFASTNNIAFIPSGYTCDAKVTIGGTTRTATLSYDSAAGVQYLTLGGATDKWGVTAPFTKQVSGNCEVKFGPSTLPNNLSSYVQIDAVQVRIHYTVPHTATIDALGGGMSLLGVGK